MSSVPPADRAAAPADRVAEIRARHESGQLLRRNDFEWLLSEHDRMTSDLTEERAEHFETNEALARTSSAGVSYLTRIDKLTAERDAALARLDEQRGATRVAAGAADRFRDVLSEFLGHAEENPGDDVLVAELREKGGFSGPEPTRWRDFLTGARAQIDQIEAGRSVEVIGPDTLCPCGKVNDGTGSGYCSYEHFEKYDGEAPDEV